MQKRKRGNVNKWHNTYKDNFFSSIQCLNINLEINQTFFFKVQNLDILMGVFFSKVSALERCIVIPLFLVLKNSLDFLFWNWFPFFSTFFWVFLIVAINLRMDLIFGNSHKLSRGIFDKWSRWSGWVSLFGI